MRAFTYVIVAGTALFLFYLLLWGNPPVGSALEAGPRVLSGDFRLIVDYETGCEYLTVRGSYFTLPRTDTDGKTHKGCGKVIP